MKVSVGRPTGEAATLFFGVIEAGNALMSRLESVLATVGLSRAKMEVLGQLVGAGEPLPLRVLADRQRCVPSNMTTLMDRMETEGLVRRIDDPNDRRTVRAELTPLGYERAAAGSEAVARLLEEFAASLSPGDRTALRQVLPVLRPK